MDIGFAEDHIRFLRYEFPGASVYPTGILTAGQIRDADWEAAPPEIRTTLGETLFVPAQHRTTLEQFCLRNGIPEHRRPDIWADLLEPFLDTWFDPEHKEATQNRLSQAGLPPQEVAEIRHRLAPLMRAYNIDSGLWDWCHLNLFDVLNAASGALVPPNLPATLGDMTAFYTWAMHIAERHPAQEC